MRYRVRSYMSRGAGWQYIAQRKCLFFWFDLGEWDSYIGASFRQPFGTESEAWQRCEEDAIQYDDCGGRITQSRDL